MSHATVGLENIGLENLPDDYLRGKSSYRHRFLICADVVKAGNANPEQGHPDPRSLYENNERLSIYVHVPWCVETCTYCYYWGKVEPRRQMRDLLDAEIRHARNIKRLLADQPRVFPSIYFGGGTPTVLPADLLRTALAEFVEDFAEPGVTEVCSEASVSSLTAEKIAIMENYVTRLSLGVQSFNDNLLGTVARSFDSRKAIELLQEVIPRFRSVNIDLIYGLQNQTMDDWLETIETAVSLRVPSITLYRLEIRTSQLMPNYEQDPDSFPDEVMSQTMRFHAQARLQEAGYQENLVGWFLRPEVQDTVVYRERWQKQTPCIAFGPGVHNYGADHFYYNAEQRGEYLEIVNRDEFPIDGFYRLSPRQQVFWFALAQWKSNAPLDLEVVADRFGAGLRDELRMRLQEFLDWQLLSLQHDCLLLTEAGKGMLEWLLQDLLEAWFGGNHSPHNG